MQLNIPIWLTLFRIIIIPFLVLIFYLPFNWAPFCCSLLFTLSALTDWFDGFLARRWKQTTRFGAFLDPVTDKVMVAVALILISENFHSWWITLPSAILIAREIIISSLREWMAEIGKGNSVSVSYISKIKTTAQMLALVALLWRPDDVVSWIGITSLYIAAVLTFWSMIKYLIIARQYLFKH